VKNTIVFHFPIAKKGAVLVTEKQGVGCELPEAGTI
jgi:hypothetical protein